MDTPAKQAPAKQFDYELAMLWGDRLRVLLNSDHISNGEITETLKRKGVFIASSEKSDTVPLLSACLLTPTEFTNLVEKSFVRESGKKYSSSKFKLTSPDADWKMAIQNNFDSMVAGIKPGDNREFASDPALSIDHDGNVQITYSVRVLDYSKEFIAQEIIYPGEILLKQSGNRLEVEVNKFRTSKDTLELNDAITGAIGKFYKSTGVITDEKPESILFDDFTNNERIRFFLQLTSVNTPEFSFKEIGNFEIIRDQEAGALPKEERIKWMEEHVNKIQIKGNDLGKIFLLQEESYYQYYYLIKMTATYAFNFGTNAGDCGITFAFSGKASRDDNYSGTVFDFSIERLPRLEEGSKNRIRKNIIQNIQTTMDAAFKHVKPPPANDAQGE